MAEKKIKRYTVTAALPYANGPVHIGHLSGVYVPADIYARYQRSKGNEVGFICGSDEHGVPITIRARKEGVSPQEIVDKYHAIIKDSFQKFGISLDVYSRTSSDTHRDTASAFFKKMYEEGKFVEKTSEQYFDEANQQFLADRYIKGTCPKCGYEEAYGDQCEACGTSLSPTDLIHPKSTISGEKPVLKETKHWYLPLNDYNEWLSEWIIDGHKEDWKSNVYGQCKSWIDSGLQPRAVTRDLNWGVPVPVDGAEGKVLYVWFDAPIGYISATKDWAKSNGKDWKPYWQSPDTKLVHFIGKDNIVFHCIIFPAMLKGHGDYILPDNVPANEFLNLEGNKISTSRNWAVWLHEYLEDFPGKEDVLRYTLCANAPETKDNDFTWKDFQARNNSELVAILGNFVNRAIVLTHKYYDGKIPSAGKFEAIDQEVIDRLKAIPNEVSKSIEAYRFREALGNMMELARIGNKYLADTEPWKLIKTDAERVKTIMNTALQICANLSILAEPFIPFTAEKLRKLLNLNKLHWENAGGNDLLKENHSIKKAELLFEKIEDEAINQQINKLMETKAANELAQKPAIPQKEEISFDDFMNMDIRTATILEAEKVKKSKKLLKFLVDTGIDKRTIVSGIAEHYKPEDLVGKQITVLVNLAPRKIMGIESQGMILSAEDKDGSLALMQTEKLVSNGSQVG
ncbi:methionine--tRNA ligase [Xanthovirga aplysinae]|uniref:methionine--tRNA ligase n=1 Tax=Xanthovirga aplysinae TaxID=2529853 RepID=UPI0012BC07DD|nr:methionine--tRNA ligase [Xanthovirga aplysinae]MTI31988.1 methionine--tRNA ligase [Xanthovirga aplysinae]